MPPSPASSPPSTVGTRTPPSPLLVLLTAIEAGQGANTGRASSSMSAGDDPVATNVYEPRKRGLECQSDRTKTEEDRDGDGVSVSPF